MHRDALLPTYMKITFSARPGMTRLSSKDIDIYFAYGFMNHHDSFPLLMIPTTQELWYEVWFSFVCCYIVLLLLLLHTGLSVGFKRSDWLEAYGRHVFCPYLLPLSNLCALFLSFIFFPCIHGLESHDFFFNIIVALFLSIRGTSNLFPNCL